MLTKTELRLASVGGNGLLLSLLELFVFIFVVHESRYPHMQDPFNTLAHDIDDSYTFVFIIYI